MCEDARVRLSARARAPETPRQPPPHRACSLPIVTSWAPETVYNRAHQGARVRPNQRRNALSPGLNLDEGQIMMCPGCSSGLPLVAGGGQLGGGRLTSQPAFRLRFYARGRKARSRFSSPQAREAVENPSQWQTRLRCSFAKVAENMRHFRPARRRLSCVTSRSPTC
jgi:hypothetical protein